MSQRMLGFLAVLAGVAVAFILVAFGEWVGHTLFPLPAGFDLSNPADLDRLIASLPLGAVVSVLVAWSVASFVGGALAAGVSKAALPAWVVGAVMLAAAGATIVAIPHPAWFVAATVPAILIPAWLAGRWFGRSR
ncbi:MAG: hypothetical protein GC150_10065 [Rhizobiales bacterium]|nr:hypothetical protein [Hyphomicrobiales bacterium]